MLFERYQKRKTRSNAISDKHKQLAQDFWSSPGISCATGNKNDIKRDRVGLSSRLEKTQTKVYKEFKAKFPEVCMGQRALEKCKPFYVTR